MIYKYLVPEKTPFCLEYLPLDVRCRIAKKMSRPNWRKNLIYTYNNWVIHKVVKPILRKRGK